MLTFLPKPPPVWWRRLFFGEGVDQRTIRAKPIVRRKEIGGRLVSSYPRDFTGALLPRIKADECFLFVPYPSGRNWKK